MRAAFALALGLNLAAFLPASAAELKGADGASRGTVTLTSAPKGVLLRIEARGLTPGWHAIHFHEKGDCTGPKFTSAGSHVHAMTPVVHGLLNPQGNDAGDLPNIHAANDGTATAELYSSLVSEPSLRDADGSAVVVHANADDYKSQPIGGAGDRVACAVLK